MPLQARTQTTLLIGLGDSNPPSQGASCIIYRSVHSYQALIALTQLNLALRTALI